MIEQEQTPLPLWWNGSDSEYPRERCIHELFQECAEARPSDIAVIFAEDRLTYGDLNARANQLAHYLRSLGVAPDVMVGICF